ncbi:hypothetical protein [Dictyobacter kobayashii]|nr:hypothetical protein [Dictyobacter kobayashii]
MSRILLPAVDDPIVEPTRTEPRRQRGGWSLKPRPRIGLDLGSDDDLLLLRNTTAVPWSIYHDYHHIGIIDPDELLAMHLCKHGTLSARPSGTQDSVEYLVLPLTYIVNEVYIYRRHFAADLEVYDMRALA